MVCADWRTMMSEIKRNIKRGLFWTAIDKYSGQIVGIGISMILARLLTPYDYGIVATATVFSSFISIFTSIGIGPAVIQRKDLSQDDLNGIFTFTILLGLVCGGIMFGSSWLVADIYDNEILVPVMQLLSITVFLGALNMVPSALMSKNLRFREMATRSLAFQVIFGIIGIVSAFFGAGVYALICPPIASLFCTFLYNNHFYPVKIHWRFSLTPIKKIFSFSSYLFLFELFNYFSRNIDKVIIGKYLSASALGYYEKSYRLMQLPLQNITAVVYPVLQPVLSSLQDNLKDMASKYTRIMAMISLLGFPLSVCLYFCASEIIVLMFGDQWLPAIPAFKILALAVPFMLIVNPTGPIFLACNASKALFYTGIINTSITISGFLIAALIDNSIESIAWGWTTTLIINTLNSYYRLYVRVMKVKVLPLLKTLIHPLFCALAVIAVYCVYAMIPHQLPTLVNFIIKGILGISTALIYYCCTGVCNINDIVMYLKRNKNK